MMQEELDTLMDGDTKTDLDNQEENEIPEDITDIDMSDDEASIKPPWTPPPRPTSSNKVVHQLDDVTRESEEKATAIFDLVEEVSDTLMDGEKIANYIESVLKNNIIMLNKLTDKFPEVKTFKSVLDRNVKAEKELKTTIGIMQKNGEKMMEVMNIMQYQDIHRQKIERVVNVMRTLSSYLNHLFEGKIDDKNRTTPAVHLSGDNDTNDVVSSDDIDALLASFGQN